MITRKVSLLIWVCGVLLIGGCNNGSPVSKINRADYDQIHDELDSKDTNLGTT
jgi:hypothetical protein